MILDGEFMVSSHYSHKKEKEGRGGYLPGFPFENGMAKLLGELPSGEDKASSEKSSTIYAMRIRKYGHRQKTSAIGHNGWFGEIRFSLVSYRIVFHGLRDRGCRISNRNGFLK
jgi:hypothetical protein